MELNHLTKDIEPSKLLDICKSHFGDQWDEVNETNFDITVLTAGFSSRLFLCTIKDGGPVVSPAKVLVRFYGGNFAAPDIVVRTMSEAAEVLLFDRLNRVGLAPQLLGVFDGGRIEQFIESRNFTHDEFRLDDKVNEALARYLARYHATDFEVSKRPFDTIRKVQECLAKFMAVASMLPPQPPPATEKEAKEIEAVKTFDLAAEMGWLARTLPQVQSRVVFCHHDVNLKNVLLRKDVDTSLPLDQQILFIDYEFSGYNNRGADIGHHFAMRFLDLGHDDVTDPDRQCFANEDQRRHFVRNYIDECKKIPKFQEDWQEDGVDSEEHIMMECELYACTISMLFQAGILKDSLFYAQLRDKIDRAKLNAGPALFVHIYKAQKKAFLAKYPQMN